MVIIYFFLSESGKNIEVPKGPISFSIKAKETKKPKIEYRTSVIYKQSCEQGESDEEVNEEGSEAEYKEKSEANGRKPEQETAVNSGSTSTENSAPEVDSIKAAERIGMKDFFFLLSTLGPKYKFIHIQFLQVDIHTFP